MTYKGALGLIETIGLSAAAAALDAATKTADVKCIGVEKVIGVGKVVSVTVNIAGDVSAVTSSVEAGVNAANKVGRVVSSRVIPRPHSDVEKLIAMFEKSKIDKKNKDMDEDVKVTKK
ncbi:MAG: microcompartment protein [Bacteroidetes bacterium 4572_77]|nr:MAG: microcompartment protein [Bacteroidetes bacterium 4572_77]